MKVTDWYYLRAPILSGTRNARTARMAIVKGSKCWEHNKVDCTVC